MDPRLQGLAIFAACALAGACSGAVPDGKTPVYPLGKVITPTMDPWERTGADLGNKQVPAATPPAVKPAFVAAPAVTAPAPVPKAQ